MGSDLWWLLRAAVLTAVKVVAGSTGSGLLEQSGNGALAKACCSGSLLIPVRKDELSYRCPWDIDLYFTTVAHNSQ